jgi:hypothetical protein
MDKTTTLKQEFSLPEIKPSAKLKKVIAKEFGPSEFTIQNILNYSKALQVMQVSNTATVLGVMN